MNFENPQDQIRKFPTSRYMGSKSKLIDCIWEATKDFTFESVLDLFSGSGTVGYMYKCYGKEVTCNDYMSMSAIFSKAMIENSFILLSEEDIDWLLTLSDDNDHFVQKTFAGLYFSDEDNALIDSLRSKIWTMNDEYKQSIALAALIRACMKKRPRGIFTYTGDRYNDGRKDLQKTLAQQFREAALVINKSIFDNGKQNRSLCGDSMSLKPCHYDLVYIDPPYYTPGSDNEYVRRYHFVEGLAKNWMGVEIQNNTKTKKFKSYPTPFSTLDGAIGAFRSIFAKYKESILVVSYSSNSQPIKDEMVSLLSEFKKNVEVIPVDYTYSFGTTKNVKRNNVQEYIFIGY